MAAPDLSVLRSRFPALGRRMDGRPCVFADAPGGSQMPEAVLDAMRDYLVGSNANTHGTFVTSEETDELIARARVAGADLLGADPDQIVFGQNATSLLLAVSRSFGRTLGRGDEVVVTRLDHDANIRPWVLAARDAGAIVRWVDVHDDDVNLDLDSLDAALSDRTRLVAVTLASNAVGTVAPATEVARRAHAAGALVCVDGVHAAQHRSIDVAAIGADIAVCSPYKFFGPHLGMLWAREELLASWEPYKVRPASDAVPDRWETGTLNHEGLAGFVAAVDYLAEIGDTFGAREANVGDRRQRIRRGFDAIGAWERELSDRFLSGLEAIEHVRLFGIGDRARLDERTPTFAVRVGEQPPIETTRALGDRGIFTWDGHYYALELMERLGLEPDLGGAVRIGFCHYSTPDEVDRVLDELATLP
ncbi:MAG: cysteine desulfurase-like protein [Actinomycetota bacterium]